jgi:4-oxalocrotonate tautomerase family enzyme
MPSAEIGGPPIKDIAIKRQLVKDVTDAMEKAYKLPLPSYVVTIIETAAENVGIAGELLADRQKK